MKKRFRKKHDVTRMVRDFFREGGSTTDLKSVREFVSRIQGEYEITSDLLAFLLQKINAFQLFQHFRDSKSKQVYPKIHLINVVEFCRKFYGYDNIYKTIHNRLLSNMELGQNVKTASLDYYDKLKKAASKNENMKNTLERDSKMNAVKKFASSKLHYKFQSLIEDYWSLRGIEKFINTSGLNTHPKFKEMLDLMRESDKTATMTKAATLDTYLDFEKSLREFRIESEKLGD